MSVNRRDFLAQTLVASAAALAVPASALDKRALRYPSRPVSFAIAPARLEIGKNVVVDTTVYEGLRTDAPLRLREGEIAHLRVTNRTGADELVHWHGLHVPSRMDGAEEEGSPILKAGTTADYAFVPRPRGSRWLHSHVMAHQDLGRGGYSGQYAFLYIDPASDPGRYDAEVFLAVHHWGGEFCQMGHPVGDKMVAYRHATFNNRLMADAEPIRVRPGQRVMFRFLNASATQNTQIALPGHSFTVVALDGNPVPRPTRVRTLRLGVAERVDALVEMNNPGVWVLGSTDPVERQAGLGRVIEYQSICGEARWVQPEGSDWDYRRFALPAPTTRHGVDGVFPMVFSKKGLESDGLDIWQINSRSYPEVPTIRVHQGRRYRFRLLNASREPHPVHFHRHSFEITAINGQPTAGLIKDTVVLPLYGSVEVEWVADNPGPALFHCHQQVHMDSGFMQMIDYI